MYDKIELGGKKMVNEEIKRINEKLQEIVKPHEIYLFGSFANNTNKPDSDYDFYLTVSDDAGDIITLTQNAYKSLRGIRKRPVDIVINYESTFESRKNTETLEKKVIEEGVLLYAE
jgi:predicted nucleotidyltransferase